MCAKFAALTNFCAFAKDTRLHPTRKKKRWGCLICLILTKFCALRRIHDCTQIPKKTFFVSDLSDFGTLQKSKTPNACIRLGVFFDQFLCLFAKDTRLQPTRKKSVGGCNICYILTNFCAYLRRIHDCAQPAKKTFFCQICQILERSKTAKPQTIVFAWGYFFDQFLCLFGLIPAYIWVGFYPFFVPTFEPCNYPYSIFVCGVWV
jgi:hypothetical protein